MVQTAFHDLQPASGASYLVAAQLAPETPAAGLAPDARTVTARRAAWHAHRGQLISHVVAARDDVLAVYEIRRVGSETLPRLLRRYTLAGRITGLNRIRTRNTASDGKERLAVSFRAAKLALLEWDDAANDLVAISVHMYERVPAAAAGGAFLSRPVDGAWIPFLRADTPISSTSRCVALSLPGGLALLPFSADGEDLFGIDMDADAELDIDLGLDMDADLDGVGLRAALRRERELPYTPSLLLPFDAHAAAPASGAAPGAPGLGIGAVRDMTFLPGFSSPTLAILHEPLPSFSGLIRGSQGRDTLALHVLTLDLSPNPGVTGPDEDNPFSQARAGATVLASRPNLPLDALYIVAPPHTIGGVIVISTTAIWHVNQAGRVIGLSVNRWTSFMTGLPAVQWPPLQNAPPYPAYDPQGADPATAPPPIPPRGPDLDLSHSQLAFLPQAGDGASAEAVLALQSGDLYSLTLHLDGRSLRELRLRPLGSTVQPSSLAYLPSAQTDQPTTSQPHEVTEGRDEEMVDMDDAALYGGNSVAAPVNDYAPAGDAGTLFVGSQVEDMELLALSRSAVNPAQAADVTVPEIADEDAALYGYDTGPSTSRDPAAAISARGGALELSMLARISALGPIAALGPTAVEGQVVAGTGARSSGSITFFEPSVRLRDQQDVQLDSPTVPEGAPYRMFPLGEAAGGDVTLLARSDDSKLLVLPLGFQSASIAPVLDVTLPERTILAAPLPEGFVRVTPGFVEVRTYTGQLSAWRSLEVTSAELLSGYVLAVQPDGVTGWELPSLAPVTLPSCIAPGETPKRVHGFEDKYQLLRNSLDAPAPPVHAHAVAMEEVDYGDDMEPVKEGVPEATSTSTPLGPSSTHSWITFLRKNVLCATTLQGDLLLSVPLTTIMSCPERWTWASGELASEEGSIPLELRVVDIRLAYFGQTPHLVMLQADGTLTAYEATPFATAERRLSEDATDAEPLETPHGIAFIKVLSTHIGRATRLEGVPSETDSDIELAPPDGEPVHGKRIQARLNSVGEQLWIAGTGIRTGVLHRPPGGTLVFHRTHSQADILPVTEVPLAPSTAPSTSGTLGVRVSVLEGTKLSLAYLPQVDYSFPVPFARHRIGRTVTHVALHPATRTLVLGTVVEVPSLLFDPEDGAAIQDPAKDPTRATCYRGIVELVSPGARWSSDGFPLKQNETICSLELVSLLSVSTAGKRRDYIAVGTMVTHGEDRPAKGGIYIFDIVQTVPDYSAAAMARGIAGKPGYKLKLIDREQSLRGPVTALCDLNGYLIHAVGQKVRRHSFFARSQLTDLCFQLQVKALENDEWLISVAFLDIGVYINRLRPVKNFILITDAYQSITLAAFQEEPYRMVVLGTYLPPPAHLARSSTVAALGPASAMDEVALTTTGDWLMDAEGSVLFVTSDGAARLRLLEYNPALIGSNQGKRLILRTEFQAASPVSSVLVLPAPHDGDESEPSLQSELLIGTLSGSLVGVTAIDDESSQLLGRVEGQLTRSIQHFAGLNPRAYRTVPTLVHARPLARGMLDMPLIFRFRHLPRDRATETADAVRGPKIAGTTSEEQTTPNDVQAILAAMDKAAMMWPSL